jgi:hypothetical protein
MCNVNHSPNGTYVHLPGYQCIRERKISRIWGKIGYQIVSELILIPSDLKIHPGPSDRIRAYGCQVISGFSAQ